MYNSYICGICATKNCKTQEEYVGATLAVALYKGEWIFMVKLIVGVKGTGKTKTLIDMANEAVKNSSGSVVCIEKGQKLIYDVSHKARVIDTSEYEICGAGALCGFVCGLCAANYDTTHVFIDSALKICKENLEEFARFLKLIDNFSAKTNISCIITASVSPDGLPGEILEYTR